MVDVTAEATMHDPDDPNDPIRAGRTMPEIRPLPPDAMPNPPALTHDEQMVELGRRQRLLEARAAARFAMQRNPYPDNRQGRRRWARELAKLANVPAG